MLQKSSFALVIPCYNEESAIPHFAKELQSFATTFQSQITETELQVIVVNNNSKDKSKELLIQLQANMPYLRIIDCHQQGYGAALRCGFANVSADFFAFADLDNTYPLLDLIQMLKVIQIDNYDLVSGGRLNENSQIPWTRRVGNQFYSKLTRLIFSDCPIVDTCSGMRIFGTQKRNEILKLKENDLSFSIELTAHALKQQWRMVEHQITYRERVGNSKLSILSDGFKFLYILLLKKFSYA